jgi:precorrin-3B C17-methyltransferase
LEYLSIKAFQVIKDVDVIVGYNTYIDLLEDLSSDDQKIISTGMTKEVDRTELAIKEAQQGNKVAMVSSGDAGVYGMAGLVLEMIAEEELELSAEIIPGITAANAAAATLGAPLMHDYAMISLSDLLTPWEVISDRLDKAAAGDFVIALYNPKSKQRKEQIVEARDIFLQYKDAATPVGIVQSAKRGTEEMVITDLEHMLEHEIDMITMIIIGNSETFTFSDLMITPRGYDL